MSAGVKMFKAVESSLGLSLAWFCMDPGLDPDQADKDEVNLFWSRLQTEFVPPKNS